LRKYLYEDKIGFVELVEHMGTDLTIVNAARVSFNKQKSAIDTKDEKLIKYLINHRHTSTFEHNAATFRVKVPLFIRSQHMRHRTWKYNEISNRYVEIGESESPPEFYFPVSFRTQHKSNRQSSNVDEHINPLLWRDNNGELENYTAVDSVKHHCDASIELYHSLINSGVCREQARMVIPQNLYTTYYATVDLHNLLHFIELRTHEGAQWEIQQVAKAMLEISKSLWPVAVQAFMEREKH